MFERSAPLLPMHKTPGSSARTSDQKLQRRSLINVLQLVQYEKQTINILCPLAKPGVREECEADWKRNLNKRDILVVADLILGRVHQALDAWRMKKDIPPSVGRLVEGKEFVFGLVWIMCRRIQSRNLPDQAASGVCWCCTTKKRSSSWSLSSTRCLTLGSAALDTVAPSTLFHGVEVEAFATSQA